jgi:hypothetical protein
MTIDENFTDAQLITKQRFKNSNDFSLYIEKKVLETKAGYMDCILTYCRETDIDESSIAKLVNSSLKEKIRAEAEENNLMKPKTGKLPL